MFNLITFLIMSVGGINWFCIGLFQFDVIAGIFGSQAHFVSRFLYVVIGIATICSLIALPIKKGNIYTKKPKNKAEKSEEKDSKQEENVENEDTNLNEEESANEKPIKDTKSNKTTKTDKKAQKN